MKGASYSNKSKKKNLNLKGEKQVGKHELFNIMATMHNLISIIFIALVINDLTWFRKVALTELDKQLRYFYADRYQCNAFTLRPT